MSLRPGKHGGLDARSAIGICVLAAVLALAIVLTGRNSSVSGLGLCAVMVALLTVGVWWQCSHALNTLKRRTRLAIAHIFSDGQSRDRDEIVREVGLRVELLRFPPVRWLRLQDRALSEMTQQGILGISAGRYSAAKRGRLDAS